ncbi:MAG: PorT family protein [Flavobacteriales bacterium]|jgi:hypothetical protein|nr:PorT family protein [Flavobacteriales bacterium]
MKKIILSLFALVTFGAQAQEIGAYLGTNFNLYGFETDFINFQGVEFTTKPRLGFDAGVLYRKDLSHFWSFEQQIGIQSTSTGINERNNPNQVDFYEKELDIHETYFRISPMVQYHFNNRWAFTFGANVRLSIYGNTFQVTNSTLLTESKHFKALVINLFEQNYFDGLFGVQYESPIGLGVYANYQLPMIRFQESTSLNYQSKGTISLGLNYRIATEKLSPYKR